MKDFTERRFLMLICVKEQPRRPSTQLNRVQHRPRSTLGLAHNPPREGGGEEAWLGGGRPLGAGDPPPVLLGHPLL